MRSSARPSSRPAPLSTASAPMLSRAIWRKKKRLRGLRRRLPRMRPIRQVPRPPRKSGRQFDGVAGVRARLLLLRALWPRRDSLGQDRRFDHAAVHACDRAAGTLAGSLSDSFQEAAETGLPEMAGLRIAETTVQRTTEGVGQRLAEHLRQGRTFGFPNHWQWHKDALGRTCAYLSLDLTGVRQQAKDGGAAEGRMPYVAMVYNPVQEWCHTMKHEGGQRILEVLRDYPLPRKKAVTEKHAEVLRYFTNNLHRMDYPTYIANGWMIGSGAVESACKTVVGQRLKLAGMRWREYGTDSMCHLRALFKSEATQWQAFWRRSIN